MTTTEKLRVALKSVCHLAQSCIENITDDEQAVIDSALAVLATPDTEQPKLVHDDVLPFKPTIDSGKEVQRYYINVTGMPEKRSDGEWVKYSDICRCSAAETVKEQKREVECCERLDLPCVDCPKRN